jgi:hypothetical protein
MKITIQDFCQDFYDSKVFPSIIIGGKMMWHDIDNAYDSIVKIEKSFGLVNKDVFRKEMITMRMEIVGVAFLHSVRNKVQLLNQSLFTKDYLDKNGQSDIWDAMGDYNLSVAKSVTPYSSNERVERAARTFLNEMKVSLYSEYKKKHYQDGMDETCIVRVINREGCEVACKNPSHFGSTARYLVAKLADRVNRPHEGDPEDYQTRASLVIWGFYNMAKDAIKSVKFV